MQRACPFGQVPYQLESPSNAAAPAHESRAARAVQGCYHEKYVIRCQERSLRDPIALAMSRVPNPP